MVNNIAQWKYMACGKTNHPLPLANGLYRIAPPIGSKFGFMIFSWLYTLLERWLLYRDYGFSRRIVWDENSFISSTQMLQVFNKCVGRIYRPNNIQDICGYWYDTHTHSRPFIYLDNCQEPAQNQQDERNNDGKIPFVNPGHGKSSATHPSFVDQPVLKAMSFLRPILVYR